MMHLSSVRTLDMHESPRNFQTWCPSNSSRTCYMLNEDLHTSQSAEKTCNQNGGHLAMIDSKKEEAVIMKILELNSINSQGQFINAGID